MNQPERIGKSQYLVGLNVAASLALPTSGAPTQQHNPLATWRFTHAILGNFDCRSTEPGLQYLLVFEREVSLDELMAHVVAAELKLYR